jgi:hypothetical protein
MQIVFRQRLRLEVTLPGKHLGHAVGDIVNHRSSPVGISNIKSKKEISQVPSVPGWLPIWRCVWNCNVSAENCHLFAEVRFVRTKTVVESNAIALGVG